ncbi:MAG TPA: hypothetical protein VGM07_21730 [Stellaceae bacterium]|jgi:hypothetical protein
MHLVSYEHIAVEAGVSLRTIFRDLRRGRLRSHVIDGKSLIDADAAKEYVAQRHAAQDALARLGGVS